MGPLLRNKKRHKNRHVSFKQRKKGKDLKNPLTTVIRDTTDHNITATITPTYPTGVEVDNPVEE
jgi:hypothetical protein